MKGEILTSEQLATLGLSRPDLLIHHRPSGDKFECVNCGDSYCGPEYDYDIPDGSIVDLSCVRCGYSHNSLYYTNGHYYPKEILN